MYIEVYRAQQAHFKHMCLCLAALSSTYYFDMIADLTGIQRVAIADPFSILLKIMNLYSVLLGITVKPLLTYFIEITCACIQVSSDSTYLFWKDSRLQ